MSLYAATSCLLVALATGAFAEGLYFVDVTTESGIQLKNTSGNKQRYIVEGMMGGAAFFDYDNDGFLDIFTANGHVLDRIYEIDSTQHHAQQNQLLRNEGGERFYDVS